MLRASHPSWTGWGVRAVFNRSLDVVLHGVRHPADMVSQGNFADHTLARR